MPLPHHLADPLSRPRLTERVPRAVPPAARHRAAVGAAAPLARGRRGALWPPPAAGQRWGANQYNNREDDLGPQPLGIAFTLAGEAPADRTPPHCLRTWRNAGPGARPSRVVVAQHDYFGGEA